MIDNFVIQVPVVAGVVINKGSKFLLVCEKQAGAYGLWNLPAGRVDVGDFSRQQTIK